VVLVIWLFLFSGTFLFYS